MLLVLVLWIVMVVMSDGMGQRRCLRELVSLVVPET